MICQTTVKKFCKDDISKIENYELAIQDKSMWHCHHRLELTLNNEKAHSKEDLKRLGMYFNRPYFELIFLPSAEHRALHNTVYRVSDEVRKKISKHTSIAMKSFWTPEKRKSVSESVKRSWIKRKEKQHALANMEESK